MSREPNLTSDQAPQTFEEWNESYWKETDGFRVADIILLRACWDAAVASQIDLVREKQREAFTMYDLARAAKSETERLRQELRAIKSGRGRLVFALKAIDLELSYVESNLGKVGSVEAARHLIRVALDEASDEAAREAWDETPPGWGGRT